MASRVKLDMMIVERACDLILAVTATRRRRRRRQPVAVVFRIELFERFGIVERFTAELPSDMYLE